VPPLLPAEMVDAERGTELADVFSRVMTAYYILLNI
jgi:hypothetical protein